LFSIGARSSRLSRAQVQEVFSELARFHPDVSFEPVWIETCGDLDQTTSLRTLEKTDFFTRELDQMLLGGKCRIAVHSAKDLPELLPQGISLIALTSGVDPSDAIVLPPGKTLENLPSGAIIATSSLRREEAVRALRSDVCFKDIRGTIERRLQALEEGHCDGVVIAEAAIIRLHLQHLNRLRLPGDAAPLQGKLAILARNGDAEMEQLFACLDSRKKSLYLGIDPPVTYERKIVHRPIIAISPRDPKSPEIAEAFHHLPQCTHLIFTSKNGVRLFFQALPPFIHLTDKVFIAVGRATQALIEEHGFSVFIVAKEETSEGLVAELAHLNNASFFWPHSSGSRPIISNFLKTLTECVLYDTIPAPHFQMPDLSQFDEIIFTSPSTIEAFLKHTSLPKDKILTCIGPVTESYLAKFV